jgi:hypothetical protein
MLWTRSAFKKRKEGNETHTKSMSSHSFKEDKVEATTYPTGPEREGEKEPKRRKTAAGDPDAMLKFGPGLVETVDEDWSALDTAAAAVAAVRPSATLRDVLRAEGIYHHVTKDGPRREKDHRVESSMPDDEGSDGGCAARATRSIIPTAGELVSTHSFLEDQWEAEHAACPEGETEPKRRKTAADADPPETVERGITAQQALQAAIAVGDKWNEVWEILHAILCLYQHPAAACFSGAYTGYGLFNRAVDRRVPSWMIARALIILGCDAVAALGTPDSISVPPVGTGRALNPTQKINLMWAVHDRWRIINNELFVILRTMHHPQQREFGPDGSISCAATLFNRAYDHRIEITIILAALLKAGCPELVKVLVENAVPTIDEWISAEEAEKLATLVGNGWSMVRRNLVDELDPSLGCHLAEDKIGDAVQLFDVVRRMGICKRDIIKAFACTRCGIQPVRDLLDLTKRVASDVAPCAAASTERPAAPTADAPQHRESARAHEARGITAEEAAMLTVAVGEKWPAVWCHMYRLTENIIFRADAAIKSGVVLFDRIRSMAIAKSVIRRAVANSGLSRVAETVLPIVRPVSEAPQCAEPPLASAPKTRGIDRETSDRLEEALRTRWYPVCVKLHRILIFAGDVHAHYFAEDEIDDAYEFVAHVRTIPINMVFVRQALIDSGNLIIAETILPYPSAAESPVPAPAPSASGTEPVHAPLGRRISERQRDESARVLANCWSPVCAKLHRILETAKYPDAHYFAEGVNKNAREFFGAVHALRIDMAFVMEAVENVEDRFHGEATPPRSRPVSEVPQRVEPAPAPAPSASDPPPEDTLVPKFEDVKAVPPFTCAVCFVNKCQLAPQCGHLCLCRSCARAIIQKTAGEGGFKCPICNTVIKGKLIRIFFG